MENVCYIIGAGDAAGAKITPGPGSLIIAADGGFSTLSSLGIKADLIIGDFDSIGYMPKDGRVIGHSPEKDDTDMLLAVKEGLKLGYRVFSLLGGTGGRLDHTLANIQTLSYIAKNGAIGFLCGGGAVITAVRDGRLIFAPGRHGFISVFCAGDKAEGVFLRGLKYKLMDAELTYSRPIGVSNEFSGSESSVEVSRGELVVLWYENEFDPKNGEVTFEHGDRDGN